MLCAFPGVNGLVSRQSVHGTFADQIPTAQELQALYALENIYNGHTGNASETPSQQAHAHRNVYNATGDASASVYGEIQPETVLNMFRISGVKHGQRYYDLGSGHGKTVILAWLMGLNATGVELADDRWQTSCDALHRALHAGVAGPSNGISFVHASFFDVDFFDADLVFLNSVMFSDDTMSHLALAARHLRPGSKIVSSHTGLPGVGFKELGTLEGSVSWSHRNSRWKIQEVVPGASVGLPDVPKKLRSDGKQQQTCTL